MYTLVKREEQKTAAWAGGTTTQLAIYPPSAEYQKFDFQFRISYATVEVEESTFTFMPGVTRHLMILKGVLEIDHLEHYKSTLEKFDIDIFPGEWPTKARGKVTDFNLMLKGPSGGLEAIILDEQEELSLPLRDDLSFTGLYLLTGNLKVKYKECLIELNEGDFILLQPGEAKNICLQANRSCEVIRTEVGRLATVEHKNQYEH